MYPFHLQEYFLVLGYSWFAAGLGIGGCFWEEIVPLIAVSGWRNEDDGVHEGGKGKRGAVGNFLRGSDWLRTYGKKITGTDPD